MSGNEMDLRSYNLSAKQIDRATKVLDYQPFIISDDIQTGVAYSWVCSSGDPRVAPKLLFLRGDPGWDEAAASNQALRALYDGFIRQICERFPGESLFDVGCNNGYFPIQAELMGMSGCAGADLGGHYSSAIQLLNELTGTSVKFIHAPYQPQLRHIMTLRKFDVVVASAILCHMASPLDFLTALSRIARRAIFFWGAVVKSDEMVILYRQPHAALGRKLPFPHVFNDDTRISQPLFEFTMRSLGFKEIIPLKEPDEAIHLKDHIGLLAVR